MLQLLLMSILSAVPIEYVQVWVAGKSLDRIKLVVADPRINLGDRHLRRLFSRGHDDDIDSVILGFRQIGPKYQWISVEITRAGSPKVVPVMTLYPAHEDFGNLLTIVASAIKEKP